jgi:hypothetical protein
MTRAINDPILMEARRQRWAERVEAEMDQIEGWAKAQGWATARRKEGE